MLFADEEACGNPVLEITELSEYQQLVAHSSIAHGFPSPRMEGSMPIERTINATNKSRQVLSSLGFTDEEIAALSAARVIAEQI